VSIPTYDVDSLKVDIKKCDDNVKLFQDTITKEYRTKADLEAYLAKLELGEGDPDLKQKAEDKIERCDKNIQLFQEAIEKEYQNKAELKRYVESAEEKLKEE
jgi:hypothetical protein